MCPSVAPEHANLLLAVDVGDGLGVGGEEAALPDRGGQARRFHDVAYASVPFTIETSICASR